MTTQRYQVTGACAPATTRAASGALQKQLFYKGQILPGDVPLTEIQHLVSVNLISPVAVPVAPVAVVAPGAVEGSEPAGAGSEPAGTGTGEDDGDLGAAEPDPDVEAKRAEARSKLPTDRSLPDGRMGAPVWVEYLVTKGYSYEALVKEEKPALVELARSLNQ